ncbi:MAG: ATP-binding cassette domain-containing protein [Hyphomicrobiaceae bacterium]
MSVVTLTRDHTTGVLVVPPAVRVRKLNHVFGSGETARQVLFDFDLDVSRGEIVLLMGPSGCGKTTVLTLVGALRSMQSGSVQTLGIDLRDADEAMMISVRRQIGFIYQAHNLHESLTAIENVRMGLEVHGADAMTDWRARCEAVLVSVGLKGFEDRYPAKLSGGQKQRVAIARALVSRPPLILADEPTAALDKSTGRQIVDLLQDLAKKQGSAILMVTHDNRILDIADRIVEMEDGRIIRTSKGGG